MSLTQYNSEPPTSGKVKVEFNTGEVVFELWSRECPKACKNFIQLCMEGYYDGCICHRLVKDFLVQTGDPTGTGEGGDSIYGEPFKKEVHSRIKFTRRGLIAMAGTDNDNGSQFFVTLGACSWLDKKHTIFGRVAGNGIFNITPMGDLETDENDRPLFPPKIIKATVLDNPFDDIVPREIAKAKADGDTKPKRKGRKDFNLMSFGEEAQEEEQDLFSKTKDKDFYKVKSSHDVLNDQRLLKETAYSEEELKAMKERAAAEEEKRRSFKERVKAAAARGENLGSDDEQSGFAVKVQKRQVQGVDDSWRKKKEEEMTLSELSMKRREDAAEEYSRIKVEMLKYKKAKKREEEERLRREADPQLTALEQRRLKYLSRKTHKNEKEQRTLQKMEAFKSMLSVTAVRQAKEDQQRSKASQNDDSEEEEEVDFVPSVPVKSTENTAAKRPDPPVPFTDNPALQLEALMDEDSDDSGGDGAWMRHTLKCEKPVDDRMDDHYVVLDPLEMANGKSKRPDKLKAMRGKDRSDAPESHKRPKLQ